MFKYKKVIFPDELLEDMTVEKTIFTEILNEIGIAMLSQLDGSANVLRIYQLMYNKVNESYEVLQELAAFTFEKRRELLTFLRGFPNLSGIEMLLLLNPINLNNTSLN